MLEWMLDTNICIYVLRHRSADLAERFARAQGRICVSSIVLSELYFGAQKSRWQERSVALLDEFVAQLAVIDYAAEAARHYAEIRLALEQRGSLAGPNDMLIAAHARSLGLTLVTNNRREFDRMPGLKVENWV